MPTRPEPSQPDDSRVLEPVRVLRPRRTDALAELFREFEEDARGRAARESRGYEFPTVSRPHSGPEPETQELPPVATGERYASSRVRDSGRRRRRAAVAIAVTAAALGGFAAALLLAGGKESAEAQAPAPSATAPAAPAEPPTEAAPTEPDPDPDGPGTLREGDNGPEVTDLQQRLLRIPNVYENGSTGGEYDARLTEAVARFQVWYGIRGDESGVYGNDTRQSLESRTSGD
ncbi:peptidoglycan-binding domain-containing protein [Streptomyces dysideae]|uniref:Peptidoglycan-binding protein n=1 Tax=Streptomyces dysideae TaxID=909626 RepID=A0A124IEH6_9ACTN|nr:peptidoglycan-binding domain-containing protein [Streptomyces dysideae]KUO18305.1 peptidoglycan-binding protein [Streptomyces dysideae]